ARHLAEAAAVLDEFAAADVAAHAVNGGLAVAALRTCSRPRAKNLLRYFISSHGIRAPSADRLDEALRQLLTAKQDARVQIDLQGAQLRRFAGRVYAISDIRAGKRWARRWRGESEIALPELGGVLVLARGQEEGISLARLRGRAVTIAVRAGGERLQPHGDRPRRSLKNLFQEARIPPWQRERLPLLFCEGDLVWAAGIGIDCAYRSDGNEPALHPAWHAM
ncbi:MAG: tRNA lysidine(34) synthetase TilS, partial [Betaproteobacteria bacterium]